MRAPYLRNVPHIRIVNSLDQRVDLRSHDTQHAGCLVANGCEGVGCAGPHDVQLTCSQDVPRIRVLHRKAPLKHNESLVAEVVNMQWCHVTRMRLHRAQSCQSAGYGDGM